MGREGEDTTGIVITLFKIKMISLKRLRVDGNLVYFFLLHVTLLSLSSAIIDMYGFCHSLPGSLSIQNMSKNSLWALL
jgi:hypothetical protein